MTGRVLLTRAQVREARAELRRSRISCLSRSLPFRYLARRVGFRIPAAVGYWIKSWDVLQTVEYIAREVPRTARILDLGANTSEILPILHRLGFQDLTGLDLAPEVTRMPYARAIRYLQGDFNRTPFDAGQFDVLTSISAIEHGYDGEAAFGEAARLLRPGGHLILSFDYWPEKIDTSQVRMYGMSWTIFSREEAHDLIQTARRHGLVLDGEADLEARDAVVQWGPWKYTFAWMVFRKKG